MDNETLMVLESLSNKLSVPVEYLWKCLIEQAFINGIVNLALMVVCLTVFSLAYYEVKNITANKWLEEELRVFPWLLLGALGVIIMLIFVAHFMDTVASLLNPEYWALKQLLGG
jgi:hypothetical protein